MHLHLTAKQVARNASYTGGFLASIAARILPLIARALPTIMTGLTTGLLSGGISKAISGKGLGDGLYLHKNSKCCRVQKTEGDGLYLSPSYSIPNRGDVLFLKQGKTLPMDLDLFLGRKVHLGIFPFWDGYCNLYFRRDV